MHLKDDIGAPLVEMLRQRHIPFVLCSGSALDERVGLFPASPTLIKPFMSDELIGAVERAADPRDVH